ncbi:MAG: NAD(P)H-flavin reductase [Wenzhouxiangellaceae bacterium]
MMLKVTMLAHRQLSAQVHEVTLQPEQPLSFRAGQYLELALPGGEKRPFSIANGPASSAALTLHMAEDPSSHFVIDALSALRQPGQVSISEARGDAWFRRDSPRPKLVIAGGAGFSYANAIFEDWLEAADGTTLAFYWGARNTAMLYASSRLEQVATAHNHFDFVPVVEQPGPDWRGASGNVIDAVCARFADLSLYDIYLGGPFPMSYYAREQFTERCRAHPQHLYSDAFFAGAAVK